MSEPIDPKELDFDAAGSAAAAIESLCQSAQYAPPEERARFLFPICNKLAVLTKALRLKETP